MAVIVVFVTIQGCKVDEAHPELVLTNGNYKDWQYYRFDVEGISENEAPACEADDRWRFYNNGRLVIHAKGTFCPGLTNPQELWEGKWQMNSGGDSVGWQFAGASAPLWFKVFKLTEDELVLQRAFIETDGSGAVTDTTQNFWVFKAW